MTRKHTLAKRQQGTALVIALVMLTSLTLISTASVDSAVMGLRIARNVEEQANAFQTAQAAVDAVIADISNLPMTGPLNQPNAVTLSGNPFVADTGAGESIGAEATRTIDCGIPPRLSNGTSLLAYSAFSFRVAADVDRTATGRGESAIRQGHLIIGPKC